jgi:hypothetical protein
VERPKKNEKNRYELASKIVSSWSREDLEDYVIREFDADYRDGVGCFEEHWDDFKDSFKWSKEMLEGITGNQQTKEALEGRR